MMSFNPFNHVRIAVSTELHVRGCSCTRCQPWISPAHTGASIPSQSLWITLAPDEPIPQGWQVPGTWSRP